MPRIVALDWDDQELRWIVAQQQAKELTLEAMQAVPLGAPDKAPDGTVAPTRDTLIKQIRQVLADHRCRHADAVVSVRRADVELRPLKLPPVPEEELPDMVRFQALREFSELAEDWPIDFYPVQAAGDQEETTVLAAAIHPKQLTEFQQVAEQAEFKLRSLVLRSCAAAALVPRSSEAEVQLMVDDFGSAIELSVLREHTAVFMRTVQPRASADPASPDRVNYLAGEIRRTILAVRNQLGGHPVERIVLFGSGAAHEELCRRLQERLQLDVQAVDPLHSFRMGASLRQRPPDQSGRFAAALGMLWEQSQQQRPAIDFLHPRRVAPPPSRHRLWAAVAGGISFLAICGGLAFWWYLRSLDGQIATLQTELRRLEPEVKIAQQQMAEAGSVQQWTQGDINWLEQLKYISEKLPKPEQARVEEWRAAVTASGDGNLVLEGLVDEQSTIAQIEQQLRGEDDRRRIRGEGGTFEQQDEKYPWRFRETVTILTTDPKQRANTASGAQCCWGLSTSAARYATMNPRERILAGLIGMLLLLMVAAFVFRRVSDAVDRRQRSVESLQAEKTRQETILTQGKKAEQKLEAYQKRSLPNERETARSLYQQWLLDQVDRAGFRSPTVRATDRTTRGRFYDQLTFQVDADGSLEQVVDFLQEFYSTEDLHRIQQLTLQPIRGSQSLDVIMVIEALLLPKSDRKTVGDLIAPDGDAQSLADLRNVILERSMFLPANTPPRLNSISDQETPRGEPFSFNVVGSDPDTLQRLSYSAVGDLPEGAQLDPDTGELRWTPRENGQHDFTIRVTDDGTPRRSDEVQFQVAVVDPPPPDDGSDEPEEPRFDEADSTYVVGTILSGNQQELWLMVRTSGELQKLSVGDPVRIGSITGVVQRIGEKEADIRTEDGDLRIRVGQSLKDGKRLNDTAQRDA